MYTVVYIWTFWNC